MLKLLSFKQTSNRRFELAFDKKIESVLIVFKEDLPRELCPAASAFFEGEALYFKINSRSFVFDIPETIDDRSKEYSLVMQITLGRGIFELVHDRFGLRRGVDKAYFFELVRQPPGWLSCTFNYDKPTGYLILGRRTISVGVETSADSPSQIALNGVPDIVSLISKPACDFLPGRLREFPELVFASKVIRLLWAGEVHDSPTDLPYADFLQLKFADKLRQMHDGSYPVSCQGMRDMFLHAALGYPRLQARAVYAHSYKPQFEGLISYTHATAELYVEGLGKWVLVDPWNGILLVTEQGKYLSAEEFANYDGEPLALALIEVITQSHAGRTGRLERVERRPSEIEFGAYTYTASGHIPNFRIYFRHLEYAQAVIFCGEKDAS